MHKNIKKFYTDEINNYIDAVTNTIIFLPYFFSVIQLIKTIFYPWKNIYSPTPKAKESFAHFMARLGTNMVSCLLGFILRIIVITIYLVIQIVFIILLPLLTIEYILFSPARLLLFLTTASDEEYKKQYRNYFITKHDPKNIYPSATQFWFERYYNHVHRRSWWDKEILFNIPPFARDWHYGFTYYLDQYCDDITIPKKSHRNLIDRKKELELIQESLSKTENANVLLVGEEGVGKRTVVQALAKLIYEGKSNKMLSYKRIIELNMENILSTAPDYITREKIFFDMIKEAESAKNIILFINNFDRYITNSEGRIDLSSVIEKYAKSNKIQIIGTTNSDNFQKYIFPNKTMLQVFDKVEIKTLDRLFLVEVLMDAAIILEKRYSIIIPTECIYTCLNLADQYIVDLPLPEKAIELMDEACFISINTYHQSTLNTQIFYPLIKKITHIPASVDNELKNKLINLEKILSEKIISQKEATDQVASDLRKAFVLKRNKNKPIASFLFFGPTGVGKTETAKVIAEIFFDNKKDIIRFDMSLYQTKHDIEKLIGSETEPGLLTSAIRQQKFGVLLLDEIEKADHQLINIFLTMIDEGYFSDGRGKNVDCRNLIIVATSNAGSGFIFEKLSQNIKYSDLKTKFINYLIVQGIFSPEFLNRFDGLIIYNPLDNNAVDQIAKFIISDIEQQVQKKYGIWLTVSPNYMKQLVNQAYDIKFGARNMQRIIQETIENKIALMILKDNLKKGDSIEL